MRKVPRAWLLIPLVAITIHTGSSFEGESASYRISGTVTFPTQAPAAEIPAPEPTPAPVPVLRQAAPVAKPASAKMTPKVSVPAAKPLPTQPAAKPVPASEPVQEELPELHGAPSDLLTREEAARMRDELLLWFSALDARLDDISALVAQCIRFAGNSDLRESAPQQTPFAYEVVVGIGFGTLMMGILLLLLQQPARKR